MAKTTKPAKRTTSTKNRGLLSKINFSSKKTQFITVIAIVAVLGGGWFTYRSFAASNVAQIGAAQLDPSPTTETKTSTGKSGQRVARLSPREKIEWTVAGNTLNNSSSYAFCVTTRYENPSASSKPAQLGLGVTQVYGFGSTNGTSFFDIRYASLADSYRKECTRTFRGWGRDRARFTVVNNGPTTARVGVMIVEKRY